ncbi:MAG: HEPN domain-containing protein [Dehalococcoidia bacterium]|nr:HEPN domain-containing protein [Dehalococcoidia bacterium]
MPRFHYAFLIENPRELDPQLDFQGATLARVEVASEPARARLEEELGSIPLHTVEVDGHMFAVMVEVETEDENEAPLIGFHQAALSLAPYSLIVTEREMMDFSRHRPEVLPHYLLIDHEANPPTVDFRYQHGASLLRLNVGDESVARVKRFNDEVVRRIAVLYPPSLLRVGEERCPLALRIARAAHWYSEAEGQTDATMAFVCYWIGLEALVLKSSTSSGKRQSLVSRLSALGRVHDAHSDWGEGVGDLWDKRSDVVHEGAGAAHFGVLPDIGAGDLNDVKYLFFIALLYAVEHHARGIPLEELWHPRQLDAYVPEVVVSLNGFPALMQALMLRRDRVPRDRAGR